MGSLLVGFLVFLFASFAFSDSVFQQRIADLVIQPESIQDDSYLLLFQEKMEASEIEEIQIADLISNNLGGPILNAQVPREKFSRSSLFDKSRANLLITIEGVGEEFSSQVASQGQKIKVVKTSYPQDDVACLTSVATGQKTSVHGIVGKSWFIRDSEYTAYRANALPEVGGMSDAFAQFSYGNSLTFSFSSDFQLASAPALHQFIQGKAANLSQNSYGYYYDAETESIESIYHTPKPLDFTISKQILLQKLKAQVDFEPLLIKENDILVRLEGDHFAAFSLSKQEDLSLFVELEFAFYLFQILQTDIARTRIQDNYPDLYFLTFSSIHKLASAYGRDSSQVVAALSLFDLVLPQLLQKFSQLYNGEISSQVLFLAPSAQSKLNRDLELKSQIYANLQERISSEEHFADSFPVIYLSRPSDEAFVEMSLSLHNAGYRILHSQKSLESVTEDGAIYQIVIWVSVILVLTLYAVIYAIAWMDVGEDSTIYRLTALVNKKNY